MSTTTGRLGAQLQSEAPGDNRRCAHALCRDTRGSRSPPWLCRRAQLHACRLDHTGAPGDRAQLADGTTHDLHGDRRQRSRVHSWPMGTGQRSGASQRCSGGLSGRGGRRARSIACACRSGAPASRASIGPAAPGPGLPVVVQAATLVDARTGMFVPLLPSDRGRFQLAHSGDVKIYENLDVQPRAYLAAQAAAAPNATAALTWLAANSDTGPGCRGRWVGRSTGDFGARGPCDIVAYATRTCRDSNQSSIAPAYLVLRTATTLAGRPRWTATLRRFTSQRAPARRACACRRTHRSLHLSADRLDRRAGLERTGCKRCAWWAGVGRVAARAV